MRLCQDPGSTEREFRGNAAGSCFLKKTRAELSVLVPVSGVVEGDLAAIEAYKSSGGDIARQLSADEVRLLNRPSAFDVGYTLVHLAIRFQRQDMLAILLTEVSAQHSPLHRTGACSCFLFSSLSCVCFCSVLSYM